MDLFSDGRSAVIPAYSRQPEIHGMPLLDRRRRDRRLGSLFLCAVVSCGCSWSLAGDTYLPRVLGRVVEGILKVPAAVIEVVDEVLCFPVSDR